MDDRKSNDQTKIKSSVARKRTTEVSMLPINDGETEVDVTGDDDDDNEGDDVTGA